MTALPRPLRADAARNRELLLAAAEAEFLEHGPEVSVADIARRAGVGKGTVFRHFATKEDLVVAVVRKHTGVLETFARGLLDAEDAGAALLALLTAAAGQRQQGDLSFLLNAKDAGPEVVEMRSRLYETVSLLVDRARAAGAIRADVTGTDVVLLMCAPNHVVEFVPNPDPNLWQRYLAIIFDGLRPEGAHPLPQPAPTSLD